MEVAIVLTFIFGIAFGSIVSIVTERYKKNVKNAYGSFKIKPVSDEDGQTGLYSVNVAIVPNQDLLNKDRIILIKDHDSHN